jgi:hypothetical protein
MAQTTGGIPGLAIPPPKITSFRDWYAIATNGMFPGRDYTSIMAQFNDEPTLHDAAELHELATGFEANVGVYIGVFADVQHEEGHTMCLHGLRKYSRQVLQTSPWDGEVFGYVQDIVAGSIQSVAFTDALFEPTRGTTNTRVHGTVKAIDQALAANPTKELLPVVAAAEPGPVSSVTRHMMLVPPRYVPLVINRRLSPRQLWVELSTAIRNNDDEVACAPLINWMKHALTRHNTGRPTASSVPPLAHEALIIHRNEFLMRLLTGSDPSRATGDPNAARMSNYIRDAMGEQRIARNEQRYRYEASRAPKSPSQYWPAESCADLMLLCGVEHEDALPELWRMAASAGKRDRIAFDRAVQNTARRMAAVGAAPVVTPDLAKRLMGLMFGGSDPDDLSEGIQPFSMVIMDHRSTATRTVAEQAREQSRNYELVTSGDTNTTLADANRLRGTTKVNVTFDSIYCDAMLKVCYIILCSMLSSDHPVAVQYKRTLDQYDKKKIMYMAHIEAHCPAHPYAKVARYFQLRLVNWFRNIQTSSVVLPAPLFDDMLRKLEVDDPTWAPTIPAAYIRAPSRAHVVVPNTRQPSAVATASVAARPAAGAAVSTAESRLTITAAIARGGPLPRINRNGRQINMCGRWHLVGQCELGCRRTADHAPHSTEETSELITWCRAAFA